MPLDRPTSAPAVRRTLALTVLLATPCEGAASQAVQRLELSGHVAPRCWSAPAADPAAPMTVRCNSGQLRIQAPPVATSSLALAVEPARGATGVAPPVRSTSGALQVLVTPRL